MAKKRSKKGRRKKGGARRGRPPGASSLSRVSTSILLKEVDRRERQAEQLIGEREALMERLGEIDAELSNFEVEGGPAAPAPSGPSAPTRGGKRGGSRGGGRRGKRGPRQKNDMTLEESMASVIRNKTMGVSEIADAVLASGYKTNAANFRTMVNQTLIKSDRFRKVERGQYTTA